MRPTRVDIGWLLAMRVAAVPGAAELQLLARSAAHNRVFELGWSLDAASPLNDEFVLE